MKILNTTAFLLLALAACSPKDSADNLNSSAPSPDDSTNQVSTAASDTWLDPLPAEKHFGKIRQLTFEGNNAEAYFSSDGKQLIFQRQLDGVLPCDQQFIMNIDGSNLHRVSNGEGRTTCGYFYDNNQRIMYASTFAEGPSCPAEVDHSQGYTWPLNRLQIYTANADGSDIKAITNTPGYNAEATLSPDGKRVIFTSTRDGDLELYTMNVDGSDVRRVTNRVGYDGGAFFSPDGKQIVWRAWYPQAAADTADYQKLLKAEMVRPSRMELWVADADGSNARQITNLGAAAFAPFFHPGGKKIIFSSNHLDPKQRNFDLFMVDLDGKNLEQVTFHPDFDAFPMFSPDGKYLVWASNRNPRTDGDTNVFIAEWVD